MGRCSGGDNRAGLGRVFIDYVERADKLAPLIAAHADQIEEACRLPGPVLTALHDAGLFRLLLPRSHRT